MHHGTNAMTFCNEPIILLQLQMKYLSIFYLTMVLFTLSV